MENASYYNEISEKAKVKINENILYCKKVSEALLQIERKIYLSAQNGLNCAEFEFPPEIHRYIVDKLKPLGFRFDYSHFDTNYFKVIF